MKTRKHIYTAISLVFLIPLAAAQDWEVPEDQAVLENPGEYTLEHVRQGKEVYLLNCKSCHGDPGKNNPLALSPMPIDIASAQMQENTDGALFYKISAGRGVMPPFSATLSENDRWMLVHYIRNYSPDREALLIDAPPVKARLLASVNVEEATVDILAEYESDEGSFAALAGTAVMVSAGKAFGNMAIGEALTDENGRAVFAIPEGLKGDEAGDISIVVSLGSEFEAGEVALEKARVGVPKEVPALIRKGVLWSTNDNVSPWVLFSFILGAGAAWITIGYVIFLLFKIVKQGRPE